MLICFSDKPNLQTQRYANSRPVIEILISVDEYILNPWNMYSGGQNDDKIWHILTYFNILTTIEELPREGICWNN